MPLTLNSIAGFADLQNVVLQAEQPALGLHVAAIAGNAQFGMTRLEFFQGKYHNGDTVILPTSPIDRYNYSRDELLYLWTINNSANPATHWLSGPDCLWYGNWKVDQTSGAVSCEEWYRKSSVHNPDPAVSQDGVLFVTTVAQRELTNLIVQHSPHFHGDMSPSIGIDKPWQQCLAQKLNEGAKFSVLNTEVMYMGEFITDDVVPVPVSPADGHTYSYSDCIFYPAWRWTTSGDKYQAPRNELGQLQRMQMSISDVGLVNTRIDMKGDLDAVFTNVESLSGVRFGRIAAWALATRPMTIEAVGP